MRTKPMAQDLTQPAALYKCSYLYRIQVIQWEIALELNTHPDEGSILEIVVGDA